MKPQKIIITGATAGIGEATAHHFAALGCDLVLTGRRGERLMLLKNLLEEKYNITVITLTFDVRNRDEVVAAFKQLPDSWHKVDVLVNNAGLALDLSPLNKGDYKDWDQMIDTNVKGLLYVSEAIMPWMIEQQKGHIINVGSTAGLEVYPGGNVYCASKHAVNAISKAMRIDLLQHGIKVTQVRPGLTETEFSMVRFKGDQERAEKVYQGYQALQPQDIADIIGYVATLPDHVNVNDIEVTPKVQANAYMLNK